MATYSSILAWKIPYNYFSVCFLKTLCVSLKLQTPCVYHTGSSTQYSVMVYMVKGSTERLDVCVCVCIHIYT